jgi:hypothetical protein
MLLAFACEETVSKLNALEMFDRYDGRMAGLARREKICGELRKIAEIAASDQS